jgi:hypothetical protein
MGDPSKDVSEAQERHPGIAGSKTLIAGLIAAFVIGFGASKLIDLGEINGLERSNGALKDQVELWKARTQVGSPDEAFKRIQWLKAKIDALKPKEPRRLNPDQQHDLEVALAPIAKEIVPSLCVFFEGTPEEARYVGDFVTVFKKANIGLSGPMVAYRDRESEKGVIVGLKNPEHPSDVAIKFLDALRKAGVEPTTTQWANAENYPGPDFALFIAGQ